VDRDPSSGSRACAIAKKPAADESVEGLTLPTGSGVQLGGLLCEAPKFLTIGTDRL